jgi:hypothetical protein
LGVYRADIADTVIVDHADVRARDRKRHTDDEEENEEKVLVMHGFYERLYFLDGSESAAVERSS